MPAIAEPNPGGAVIDAEALLVHGPFLRRLAASLLHDAAAADDVVQEAWLKALQGGPRDRGKLRAWLATVTRRLAFERGRREGRRRAREAGAARPESLPSAAEIAEREAVRQQVVDAVLGLPEPYRTAILLRYYEDLPPRHIARELGVPVETVRTRLKRGQARLAEALDGGHGGDRRRWALALLPLAFPKSAAAAVGGGLLATLVPTTPAGKLVVLAGLVAIGVGLESWFSEPDAPPSSPLGLEAKTVAATGDVAPLSPALVDSASELASPVPADVPSAEPLDAPTIPGARIEGRVLGADGTPRPGVEVLVVGVELSDPELVLDATVDQLDQAWRTQLTRTDASGRYALAGLQRGVWVVGLPEGVDHPVTVGELVFVDIPTALAIGAAEMMRRRARELEAEIPRPRPLGAEGLLTVDLVAATPERRPARVVDLDGRPLAGATLRVLPPAAQLVMSLGPYPTWMWGRVRDLVREVEVDASGRVPQLLLPRGSLVLASAPGHRSARVELAADAPLPGELVVELATAHPRTIAGQVVDIEGEPVAGAEVALTDTAMFGGEIDTTRRFVARNRLRTTRTDAAGRFDFGTLHGCSTSEWAPRSFEAESRASVVALRDGYLVSSARVEPGPEPQELRVELLRGGLVELTVLDRATLGPAEGVRVRLAQSIPMASLTGGPPRSLLTALARTTDADGFASFERRMHGPIELTVSRPGFEPHELQREWAGEPIDLLLGFERVGWELAVRVVDPAGRALPPALGDLEQEPRSPRIVVQAWAHDPRALLGDPARWRRAELPRVTGRLEGDQRWFAFDANWQTDQAWLTVTCEDEILAVEHVARGETHAELVARGDWLSAAPVPVRIRFTGDSGAAGVFGRSVRVHDASGRRVSTLTWEWGTDQAVGVVPGPGTYELRVDADSTVASRIVDEVVVPVGGLETELELSPVGSLRIRARDARGESRKVVAQLLDAEGRVVWAGDSATDPVRGVPVGELQLRVTSGWGCAQQLVRVHPGQTTEVVLGLGADSGTTLRLAAPVVTPPATLVVDDAEGRRWVEQVLWGAQLDELATGGRRVALPPGAYRATLFAAGEVAPVARFEVPEAAWTAAELAP